MSRELQPGQNMSNCEEGRVFLFLLFSFRDECKAKASAKCKQRSKMHREVPRVYACSMQHVLLLSINLHV